MGTKIQPHEDKLVSLRDTEDISSFLDNELKDIDFDKLHGAEAKEAWADYTLISDALKTPELAQSPRTRLQSKIFQALENEPAHKPQQSATVIPMPKQGVERSRKRWLIPGLATAAVVTTVSWISLPSLDGTNPIASPANFEPNIPTNASLYLTAHRNLVGFSSYRNKDALVFNLRQRAQGSNE